MTPDDFVCKIKSSVVEDNSRIYRKLFTSTDINTFSDAYWIKAINLFNSLNESQREVFFDIMKQVSIDAISNIFGIIDGSSNVEELTGDFKLVYLAKNDSFELHGDMQDLFLSKFE